MVKIEVDSNSDIQRVINEAFTATEALEFTKTKSTMFVTAVVEIAKNLIIHANGGTVLIQRKEHGDKPGLEAIIEDTGPGIENIDLAMQDHFSTAGGLGIGLPGAQRLVDEFEITSAPSGTKVTLRKWQ